MSSFRLDPRRVAPDNWKRWHADALRLWLRLGWVGWIVGMGLPLIVLSWVETHLSGSILITMGIALPVLCVGYLLMPFQMAMLSQARKGGPVSMPQAMKMAGTTWKQEPAWFAGRMGLGIGFILLAWSVVAGILSSLILVRGGAVSAAQANLIAMLMAHLTSYLWMLQPRGMLDMGLFLRVREQLEPGLARGLNTLGIQRNRYAMTQASMTLLYAHLGVILLALAWAPAMIALPWLSWHSAGVVLGAWHDIFDPDGGLAAKQKHTRPVAHPQAVRIPVRRFSPLGKPRI